jgi:hypothetical protein
VKLQHGDRLVLGPARLVCLFISEPLSLAEKQKWTYDHALHETLACGGGGGGGGSGSKRALAWAALSPARRAAAEAVAAVEAQQVEQAKYNKTRTSCIYAC